MGGSLGGKNGLISVLLLLGRFIITLDCGAVAAATILILIGDGRRHRLRLLQRELEIHVVKASAIMRTKKTKEGMSQNVFSLVKFFNVGVQLAVNTELKG